MKVLDRIIDFKGNIPSVLDLRLGESYHDYYEHFSLVQDRHTGDCITDYWLEEYLVFVDISSADERISEIRISYHPYHPFSFADMEKVVNFFKRSFDYKKLSSNIDEEGEAYSYCYTLSNDRYSIYLHKDSDDDVLSITFTSKLEDVSELQGANIYYYHEPSGIYGVRDSALGLSNTKHAGTLSREDVIDNLISAMKRNNEYGEDWHYDYAYSFLHKDGMIMPLEDESLLEDEDYIRQHAEEMTEVNDYRGGQAQELLNIAGVGKHLIPIEEIFKEELLSGEISDLEEYFEEMSSEWTLAQVLPYESLDY